MKHYKLSYIGLALSVIAGAIFLVALLSLIFAPGSTEPVIVALAWAASLSFVAGACYTWAYTLQQRAYYRDAEKALAIFEEARKNLDARMAGWDAEDERQVLDALQLQLTEQVITAKAQWWPLPATKRARTKHKILATEYYTYAAQGGTRKDFLADKDISDRTLTRATKTYSKG